MKDPNAGELTARIEILALEAVEDADGYFEEREVVKHRTWAKVTEQSGTELIRANSDFGQAKVRFLFRWTPKQIHRKMTVRWEGRIYPIEYVNRYGDTREWMELWCTRETREVR